MIQAINIVCLDASVTAHEGVGHVWDDCRCGCDPDWHYLTSTALLRCGNCEEGDT